MAAFTRLYDRIGRRSAPAVPLTNATPAQRAEVIAISAKVQDPSLIVDMWQVPIPCAEIGIPIGDHYILQGGIISVYAATEGFTTSPTDTPPNQTFGPHLAEPFNIAVELFPGVEPTGAGRAGAGRMTILDPESVLDSWLNYGWGGRTIDFIAGAKGTSVNTWATYASLTCDQMTYDTTGKYMQLRDLQFRMYAIEIPHLKFAGTGGIDGDVTIQGQFVPCCFGRVFNFEPPLINAGNLVYQWHFREVEGITAARDGGSPLTFFADYPTYAALVAATIPAGQYATCNAFGLLRLQTKTTFGLRIDGKGDKLGGVYVETRADIAKRLATTIGSLALDPVTNIDAAYFTALNTVQPGPCGIAITSSTTIGAVLDEFMAGCGGWGYVSFQGKMRVGRQEVPTVADHEFWVVPDLAGEPSISDAPAPRRQTTVSYQINWAPQDKANIAGAVSSGLRQLYADEASFSAPAQGTDDTVVAGFPAATKVQVKGFYALVDDANAEALRQRTMFAIPRRRWRVPMYVNPFRVEFLNSAVAINGMNRLNWGDRKLFRCVGVETSGSAEKCILHLWEGNDP